jgi:hypothetical protein
MIASSRRVARPGLAMTDNRVSRCHRPQIAARQAVTALLNFASPPQGV